MNNAQEQEKNAAAADLPERPRRKTVWKICRKILPRSSVDAKSNFKNSPWAIIEI